MKNSFLSTIILILICFCAQAQFGGIVSFWTDTTLRMAMKTHNVRSVTEYIKTDSTKAFNGRYIFNNHGLATDLVTGRGPYYSHMRFEYNTQKQVVKQIYFQNMDTAKMEYWKGTVYDAKGRMVKVERGLITDGALLVRPEFEIKYLSEKPRAGRWESKRYDGPRLLDYSLGHDSIAGRDTMTVTYKYGVDRFNGKKVAIGKTLSRARKINDTYFMDELEYRVYGKTEVVSKITTRYDKITARGRWTEFGEVDYEEAYAAYAQEHPDDFNINYYSPPFVKAVLDGKIQGQVKPENKYTFNDWGQLEETYLGGYRIRYTYNPQGQVTQQITYNKEGRQVNAMQLWYNNKGLIIKTRQTTNNQPEEDVARSAEDEGSVPQVQELIYEYTFY